MKTKIKTLTRQQKRVLICKDVIKQVKAGLTKTPKNSYYCRIPGLSEAGSGELKPFITKRPCFGCAKGAIFLAHVRRFDKVKIESRLKGSGDWGFDLTAQDGNGPDEYFNREELDVIEAAYEGYPGDTASARTARLIAICNHIIKTKGETLSLSVNP